MLVMITFLDACDNTTSNIKPDNNLSYSPVTPTQTPQTPQTPRTYKQTTYSGVFQKPGELEPAVEFCLFMKQIKAHHVEMMRLF